MKRIALIAGSLRERPFNRQLAEEVRELLAGRADVYPIDHGLVGDVFLSTHFVK